MSKTYSQPLGSTMEAMHTPSENFHSQTCSFTNLYCNSQNRDCHRRLAAIACLFHMQLAVSFSNTAMRPSRALRHLRLVECSPFIWNRNMICNYLYVTLQMQRKSTSETITSLAAINQKIQIIRTQLDQNVQCSTVQVMCLSGAHNV